MKAIYKMTREDKRRLCSGHMGRMTLHLSAGHGNTTGTRFDTLHFTRWTFVPKKGEFIDPHGKCETYYDVDDCGAFDCLSDVVFVLKETGRLDYAPTNENKGNSTEK